MRALFHPQLVNEPFGDAGLYVDLLFERRALLFDLGEIQPLPPRKILRISHVFVSHTHMDHFMGFDRLLRICLGRDKGMQLFGPPAFIDQVEHKLAAYTWNLVHNYANDFTLTVTELHPGGTAQRAAFHVRTGFRREALNGLVVTDGVLLDEAGFRVRCAFLDHRIPCLGFALEEKQHINIWKNRLAELGLPVGPWLHELKLAVARGMADDAPFRVWWRAADGLHERQLPLGLLKDRLLRIVPGQKIGYVVDTICSEENAPRIVALVRGADQLFIETPFLHEDLAHARDKYHLTARQAGLLAREAGVKRLIPFHFSPRYLGREALLRQEAEAAFAR